MELFTLLSSGYISYNTPPASNGPSRAEGFRLHILLLRIIWNVLRVTCVNYSAGKEHNNLKLEVRVAIILNKYRINMRENRRKESETIADATISTISTTSTTTNRSSVSMLPSRRSSTAYALMMFESIEITAQGTKSPRSTIDTNNPNGFYNDIDYELMPILPLSLSNRFTILPLLPDL